MVNLGGFFELELVNKKQAYHANAMALTTGRSCLHQIVKLVRPKCLYIPFYCCNALISPLLEAQINFKFYGLEKNLDPILPQLEEGDYLLYTDFFGLKNKQVEKLKKTYGQRLILDRTHAFFQQTNSEYWSFTVCRKYYGVPDGAYLDGPNLPKEKPQRNHNVRVDFSVNRLLGKQQLAFQQYQAFEAELNNDILGMSLLTEMLLSNVDYEFVANKRKANFDYLNERLAVNNKWDWSRAHEAVPFCYPYWPELGKINRSELYQRNFFIPTYWADTANREGSDFDLEKTISSEMLPLPVDHRYGIKELEPLVEFLLEKASL